MLVFVFYFQGGLQSWWYQQAETLDSTTALLNWTLLIKKKQMKC